MVDRGQDRQRRGRRPGRHAPGRRRRFGAGIVGDAFVLAGNGDYVDVADAPSVDVGAGDFTVGLWVRFNETAGEQVLVEKWIQGRSSGWTLTKLPDDVIGFAVAAEGGGEVRIDSPPSGAPPEPVVPRRGATKRNRARRVRRRCARRERITGPVLDPGISTRPRPSSSATAAVPAIRRVRTQTAASTSKVPSTRSSCTSASPWPTRPSPTCSLPVRPSPAGTGSVVRSDEASRDGDRA